MAQWEYTTTETNSTNAVGLAERLNVLGAEGWECIGIGSPDKTIGMNSLVAVLKRQIIAPPRPASLEPAWHVDPCARFDKRYWDGNQWTAHVATEATKTTGIDPPTFLPPPPP